MDDSPLLVVHLIIVKMSLETFNVHMNVLWIPVVNFIYFIEIFIFLIVIHKNSGEKARIFM